jgi:hypothetical protein
LDYAIIAFGRGAVDFQINLSEIIAILYTQKSSKTAYGNVKNRVFNISTGTTMTFFKIAKPL